MLYLDNAATTFPKPYRVLSAVRYAVKSVGGNPGRSSHTAAMRAAEEVYETREQIAALFSCPNPENVVFTLNATHALNVAIKGTIHPGDTVLISDLEHNAVLRPLKMLEKTAGVHIRMFETGALSEERLRKLAKDGVSVIVSTLASNVTGKVIPIDLLSRVAREVGVPLIVDASQAAGHQDINLEKTPVSVLCAPGHKGLFGISGVGFMISDGKTPHGTLIEGGSGTHSRDLFMPDEFPERFEAGTLPVPAILGLGAGVRFVRQLGEVEIAARLRALSSALVDRLSSLPNVSFLSAGESGIVSFSLRNIGSEAVAEQLAHRGIAVRGGLHCAPLAHETLGTLNSGTVRVSFSVLNRIRDVDTVYREIKTI